LKPLFETNALHMPVCHFYLDGIKLISLL